MKIIITVVLLGTAVVSNAAQFKVNVIDFKASDKSFECFTKSDLTMDEEISGVGALTDKKIGNDLSITANQSEGILYLSIGNQNMLTQTTVFDSLQQTYQTTSSNIGVQITKTEDTVDGNITVCGGEGINNR